jgi:hypothetical protein
MVKILLNGATVDAYDFSDEVRPNEFKEDKEERTIQFSFDVIGQQNFHLFTNFIKNSEMIFKCDELNIDDTFSKKNFMSTYSGALDDFTEVTFKLELTEIETSELNEEQESPFVKMARGILDNRTRVRTILDLLIEKGLITHDEYIEKFDILKDEKFEEFKKELIE